MVARRVTALCRRCCGGISSRFGGRPERSKSLLLLHRHTRFQKCLPLVTAFLCTVKSLSQLIAECAATKCRLASYRSIFAPSQLIDVNNACTFTAVWSATLPPFSNTMSATIFVDASVFCSTFSLTDIVSLHDATLIFLLLTAQQLSSLASFR